VFGRQAVGAAVISALACALAESCLLRDGLKTGSHQRACLLSVGGTFAVHAMAMAMRKYWSFLRCLPNVNFDPLPIFPIGPGTEAVRRRAVVQPTGLAANRTTIIGWSPVPRR
jgi:hypothetical protein